MWGERASGVWRLMNSSAAPRSPPSYPSSRCQIKEKEEEEEEAAEEVGGREGAGGR